MTQENLSSNPESPMECASTSSLPPMDTIATQLIIEEYKSTRSILEKNIDIMEKNEIFSVGAVAAAIAFSIGQSKSDIVLLSTPIPVFIAICGYFRFIALDLTIAIYNGYFVNIENRFGSASLTTYFRQKRDLIGSDRAWGWSLLASRKTNLGLLILVSSAYMLFTIFVNLDILSKTNILLYISCGVPPFGFLWLFSYLHSNIITKAKTYISQEA